jgi:MATE family multidrug resistance protein
VPLAALNTTFSINGLAFMPAFGVASAGAILVGQAVGAKNLDEVPRVLKLTAGSAAAWMGAVAVSYVVAPRAIFSLFVSDADPDAAALLSMGAMMLAWSTSWQLFDALGMTLSESLRAMGDTAWTLRARIVLAWALFVPIAYLTVIVLDGGIPAAIANLIGYLVLLAAAFYWRYRSGAWKKIELVEDLPPEALD